MSTNQITNHRDLVRILTGNKSPVGPKTVAPSNPVQQRGQEVKTVDKESVFLPTTIRSTGSSEIDPTGKYIGKPKGLLERISRSSKKSSAIRKDGSAVVENNIERGKINRDIQKHQKWEETYGGLEDNFSGPNLEKYNNTKNNIRDSLNDLRHRKKHADIEYHKLAIKKEELSRKPPEKSDEEFERDREEKIESHDREIEKLRREVREEHDKLREEEHRHHHHKDKKHHHHHHDIEVEVDGKKDEDHGSNRYLDKVTNILDNQDLDILIYYGFLSLTIFTITLIYAFTDKDFKDDNEKLLKEIKAFFITGLVSIAIFLGILGVSFGSDKDFKQKIASFGMLLGTFFTGSYFTFLILGKKYNDLNKAQISIGNLLVGLFITFYLISAAYVLFAKRTKESSKIIRIIYSIAVTVAFFVIGGALANFRAKANFKDSSGLKFFLDLCLALFIIGIIGLIFTLISFSKSANEALAKGFNSLFKSLEPTNVKIVIYITFVCSIYLTAMLYALSKSFSLSDDRIEGDKDLKKNSKKLKNFRDVWVKNTYIAGIALISYFVLSLAMSFGGTLKERLFAIFLTAYIISTGLYMIYLEYEQKFKDLKGTERTIFTVILVLFVLMFLGSLYYVLFHNSKGNNVLFDDILRLVSNFGAIVYFLFSFAIIIATMILFKPSSGHDHMHQKGWAAIGISSGVIVISGLILFFL